MLYFVIQSGVFVENGAKNLKNQNTKMLLIESKTIKISIEFKNNLKSDSIEIYYFLRFFATLRMTKSRSEWQKNEIPAYAGMTREVRMTKGRIQLIY